MSTRPGIRALLVRSARRTGTQHRVFSASCRRQQAEAGSETRGNAGTHAKTASSPNAWSGGGVAAVAVAAAAASWATAWMLQRNGNGRAARQLVQYGVDLEPRYATMDEMKEVSFALFLKQGSA
jgi:hypothetical protein